MALGLDPRARRVESRPCRGVWTGGGRMEGMAGHCAVAHRLFLQVGLVHPHCGWPSQEFREWRQAVPTDLLLQRRAAHHLQRTGCGSKNSKLSPSFAAFFLDSLDLNLITKRQQKITICNQIMRFFFPVSYFLSLYCFFLLASKAGWRIIHACNRHPKA